MQHEYQAPHNRGGSMEQCCHHTLCHTMHRENFKSFAQFAFSWLYKFQMQERPRQFSAAFCDCSNVHIFTTTSFSFTKKMYFTFAKFSTQCYILIEKFLVHTIVSSKKDTLHLNGRWKMEMLEIQQLFWESPLTKNM